MTGIKHKATEQISGLKIYPPAVINTARKFFYLLSLLLIPGVVPAAESDPLRFGVLPVMSPVTLLKRFAPISQYLSAQTGRPITLESARDFPTFVRRVAAGRYDLVFTAPHLVALAMDKGRFELLAAPERTLVVSIIVPVSAPFERLTDLKGKVIATPPEEAFVSMVGQAMFEEAGVGTSSGTLFLFTRSHNGAYQAVLSGEADAAVISDAIARRQLSADDWRTLATSKNYPASAFLAATDLDTSLRQHLRKALLTMHSDAEGRKSLSASLFTRFLPVADSDYRPLRHYLNYAPALKVLSGEQP